MATEVTDKRTYKIGDVCRLADVQPYVLRYWETEFPALAPAKTGGGQRSYTQREVDIVLRIKQLLYSEGFTIAGAKKKLEAELNAPASEPVVMPVATTATADGGSGASESDEALRAAVSRVRDDLRSILDILRD